MANNTKSGGKNIKGKKTIKKISDTIDNILIVFFILIALLGTYPLIDKFYVYYQAQDKTILKYKPELLDDGTADNSKALIGSVAWLTIDDTNIDYPVMQGKTNSEYLNKDPFGDFSLSGSLFLDYRNNADFTDPYSLIYGHHMERGTMFGALDEFKDQLYLKKHEKGTLIVGNTVYDIHLFACITADAKDEVIFNPSGTSAEDVLTKIASTENSVKNMNIDTSDKKLIALSTCQGDISDNRTIVFGTLERK